MALLFLDLDGTLTDPKPGITGAVAHALAAGGVAVPSSDELEWVIGPPMLDNLRKLGAPDPELALSLYRKRYASDGLFDCAVYDGVPAALATLQSDGHRLFLATAKPHVFARRITAHFGLNRYLEAEFGPELDGTRNDKGQLLAYACDLLGVSAGDGIMVGDRINDKNAARANGMRFVGVAWGYGTSAELAGADALCETPGDLSAAIRRLTA